MPAIQPLLLTGFTINIPAWVFAEHTLIGLAVGLLVGFLLGRLGAMNTLIRR
jgi:uncharacterized membrane-anchored protein YhcB (DUF1043 family)